MLDEKGMVAALKAAYKEGGYRVVFSEGHVMIVAGYWAVDLDEEYIWPKVLGTVVEHIGMLPQAPAAYICQKDYDPGSTCMLDPELERWATIRSNAASAETAIRRTRLTINGHEIWQTGKSLKVMQVDPAITRIVDEEGARRGCVRLDSGDKEFKIYFKGFAELAVICGLDHKDSPEMARIEGFPWMGEGS